MDFRIACCAVLLLFAQPAVAQEAFIKGVYSTPEGCAALKAKKGTEDYVFLSATGLEGTEFNCEFVQIYPRKSMPGWAAVAFCEEPGLSYPELFSILPLDDTSLHLGTPGGGGSDDEADDTTADSGADDSGLDGDYQLCDAGAK
jgi:hypothetical protein